MMLLEYQIKQLVLSLYEKVRQSYLPQHQLLVNVLEQTPASERINQQLKHTIVNFATKASVEHKKNMKKMLKRKLTFHCARPKYCSEASQCALHSGCGSQEVC